MKLLLILFFSLLIIRTNAIAINDKSTSELDSISKEFLIDNNDFDYALFLEDSVIINFNDFYIEKCHVNSIKERFEFFEYDWQDFDVQPGKILECSQEYIGSNKCYIPYIINQDLKIEFKYLFYNSKWFMYEIRLTNYLK